MKGAKKDKSTWEAEWEALRQLEGFNQCSVIKSGNARMYKCVTQTTMSREAAVERLTGLLAALNDPQLRLLERRQEAGSLDGKTPAGSTLHIAAFPFEKGRDDHWGNMVVIGRLEAAKQP